MADITADLVKKLREKSGSRMMDCKKALDATKDSAGKGNEGWLGAAEAWLRTQNLSSASAFQGRAAEEGLLGYKLAASGKAVTVVEMTANTDFVAKNPEFLKLLNDLVDLADEKAVDSAEKLKALSIHGVPVSEAVNALTGKIGENISIKRVARVEGDFGYYIHFDNKQGAIVEVGGVSGEKAQALGKDISMHIVFAKPTCLVREEVSQELIKKETEIATERLKSDPKNANKPPEILAKIISGQVNKFYSTLVLPDQPYYKDGNKTVAQVLNESGATVKRFVRFQVGVV